MSDSDCPLSMSGNKRAASPTNAVAEVPAQRPRLSEAAASDPPAAARPPLSAAQRCAADTLTLVFGFVRWNELLCAARTCKAWLAASAKEQPRGLILWLSRADRLAAVCASSSPFKKHISRVDCGCAVSLCINRLVQLCKLPQLTALKAKLSAASLIRLMDEGGGGALAALTAAFPPKLRQFTLVLTKKHTAAVCQQLLDGLPAMAELEDLTMDRAFEMDSDLSATLALEQLLQLPRLTHLSWDLGDLTAPQLQVIKQISTLRNFHGADEWTADQLSALCRPPHRLQQLQEITLSGTSVSVSMMEDLVRLPALTALVPGFLTTDAYAFLPRFSHLQRLSVHLGPNGAAQQAEHDALLVSALSACPVLAELSLIGGECSESIGSQLMQAVPRLRTLRLQQCSLSSLRFLRHAPNLKELSLICCRDVRPDHVFGLGSFAPQLECLSVLAWAGLQLDEAEQRLLTPPGALGLPRLREFNYRSNYAEGSDASDEDVESDFLDSD